MTKKEVFDKLDEAETHLRILDSEVCKIYSCPVCDLADGLNRLESSIGELLMEVGELEDEAQAEYEAEDAKSKESSK